MSRQTQPDQRISRRRFLRWLGVLGGGAAVGVAGAAYGLSRLLSRQPQEPRIVVVTSTPAPTPDNRPQIVRRADWGAVAPNHNARNEFGFYDASTKPEGWYTYDAENLATAYQTVVVHHSVLYEADDRSTLLEIQRTHRVERGWADVAYHYFVGKTGMLYEGRTIAARGAHVGGYNTGSVGVCLLGNFEVEQPASVQIQATQRLLNWLAQHLQLTHLAAHSAFNSNTVCPGDKLAPYLLQFAAQAGLQTGTEGYIPPDA
jgi:hypothetical protein